MERFPSRLNQPPDLRADFLDPEAILFTATKLDAFDPKTGEGRLAWDRNRRKPRVAFSHMTYPLEPVEAWEFPAVFPEPKSLPFKLEFTGPASLRLRQLTREGAWPKDADSLMLAGPVPRNSAWKLEQDALGWQWLGPLGHRVVLKKDPYVLEIFDASGRSILRSHAIKDGECMITGRPLPSSFCRRPADLSQSLALSFSLAPGEKIFGCGESFTGLNKRGQCVTLWTQDAHGSQSQEMYKPVPFYLSDRGYGVFVHGSSPMAFDFGESYADTQVLYCGEESADLFLFLGGPAEVLSQYTALTGRSPQPPLWSFGLWMSRITYSSEAETREVAARLKEHRIPCDVIHLDTGWFEHDWCCDYLFSPSRFGDAKKMIADLKASGQRLCLWQLPYFTPKNRLYQEIIDQGLAVKGPLGGLPTEEAVLDFSNPATVAWYQKNLKGLLDLGVAAIKVDFGEGAPFNGMYASGRTGWQEHNLYPLRYNKAAAEISSQTLGYPLIWARSAWAGSQRYPLHWGGDAEASDGGMLGTLRGGLSLGLSGFSYWSHDAGGFFPATPKELYLRWLCFTALSSHARCHGLPPTEPWHFDAGFQDVFRKIIEFRYRLMPYLWAQAARSSALGHPLLRPLFFEFPQDPGSWLVEDEYLLGSDILVAPLFEEAEERLIYLPPGEWVDLQSGASHRGPGHLRVKSGEIPCLILGRAGAAIPTAEPAPHTGAQDWDKAQWWLLGKGASHKGLSCPKEGGQARLVEFKDGKAEGIKQATRAWT